MRFPEWLMRWWCVRNHQPWWWEVRRSRAGGSVHLMCDFCAREWLGRGEDGALLPFTPDADRLFPTPAP
jgi:hypothetical protein